MRRATTLAAPSSLAATGIIGSIKTNDWGLPILRKDPTAWQACVIVADGAQVGKLVFRYLIAEADSYERLIIGACPCGEHNISSATKWSVTDRPGHELL